MEISQELPIVGFIAGLRTCEAGRKDTRSATQRINAKARVVGKYRALHTGAVVKSFLACILFEARTVFDAARKALDVANRFNGNTPAASRLTEFSQFAGIGRSQKELARNPWSVFVGQFPDP